MRDWEAEGFHRERLFIVSQILCSPSSPFRQRGDLKTLIHLCSRVPGSEIRDLG